METLSMKTQLWTATALLFGLLLAVHSAIAAQPSPTPSIQQTATYGYGPGMMGPGMMYNWTPEQRQQYWDQMRQFRGYGPGRTMEPPTASPPQTSGQRPAG
jgi:Spy/CpxP family protein refolding chaperone